MSYKFKTSRFEAGSLDCQIPNSLCRWNGQAPNRSNRDWLWSALGKSGFFPHELSFEEAQQRLIVQIAYECQEVIKELNSV